MASLSSCPAPAIEPDLRLPRRADRDAVEPGAQPVGVADRQGLAGQHEEDGLEGVLGVVVVAQELSADAQHHRPVPRHERGERRIPGRVAAGGEPLHQLPVGQSPATEPPSKSDSICPTNDLDACAMSVTQLARISRFALIPPLDSAPPPFILSRVGYERIAGRESIAEGTVGLVGGVHGGGDGAPRFWWWDVGARFSDGSGSWGGATGIRQL